MWEGSVGDSGGGTKPDLYSRLAAIGCRIGRDSARQPCKRVGAAAALLRTAESAGFGPAIRQDPESDLCPEWCC